MKHRILRPTDYRAMPWKNGGGVTTEIAAHPPDSDLDGFLWRVSIADVAASGPFSRFVGVDRCIVLLSGEGMTLRAPAGDVVLRPFEPHRFSGDAAIEGVLSRGPVRDFNVMTRRGRARAHVTVDAWANGPARGATILIHCAAGSAGSLAAGETMLLEDVPIGAPIDPRPGTGSRVLRVDFDSA